MFCSKSTSAADKIESTKLTTLRFSVSLCSDEMDQKDPAELHHLKVRKRSFLSAFPMFWTEPVLVKCSFLFTDGSKRPFFHLWLCNT